MSFVEEAFVFFLFLGIGWFLNRKLLTRFFNWSWLAGMLWLAYGIYGDYHMYQTNPWYPIHHGTFSSFVWHNYLANRGERDTPLTLVIFTMPALGMAGLSLGARLALRHK